MCLVLGEPAPAQRGRGSNAFSAVLPLDPSTLPGVDFWRVGGGWGTCAQGLKGRRVVRMGEAGIVRGGGNRALLEFDPLAERGLLSPSSGCFSPG